MIVPKCVESSYYDNANTDTSTQSCHINGGVQIEMGGIKKLEK